MVAIQQQYPDFPMGVDQMIVPLKVQPSTHFLPPEPLPTRLFKYTDRQWAVSMVEDGELLVRPASEFKNAENLARQDDELTAKNRKLQLEAVDHPILQITSTSGLGYSMTSRQDYYIWASAKSLSAQLFRDFRSDSCVVILDVPTFISRLKNEFESRNLTFHCRSVIYHNGSINSFEGPYFFKVATGYANQDEYRVVGIPGDGELKPFFAKIGSLKDIAKVLTIEDCP